MGQRSDDEPGAMWTSEDCRNHDKMVLEIRELKSAMASVTQFCFQEDDRENHPLTTAYVYVELRDRGAETWWILHGYRRNDDGSLYSFIDKAATQAQAIEMARAVLAGKKQGALDG